MRRISIVFAETDDKRLPDNQGFSVFIEGFDPKRRGLADDQLSAAEFWASKCFALAITLLKQVGVLQSASKPD